MSKTKNKIVALIVTTSFPVMLFFQNCGQQGSLQVTSNGMAANSSMGAGSDIPKDPVVDDGGMVIVPPSLPPVVSQPATSTPPSVPQDPSGPTQPPVQQPPVVVNPPVQQPPAGGGSSSGHPPQDPNVPGSSVDCKNIKIADIRLSIAGIGGEESTCGGRSRHGAGNNSPDFELVDANATVSLNNQKIRIRALKNVELKQIFLRLNESGNQVLSMDNAVMNLFTPSAQESGLKLHLEKSVKLKIDQVYELHLDFRAEDQIVANANKCIFKPVIKSVKIEAESSSSSQSNGHKCDRDDDDEKDHHDDDDRSHGHDEDHNQHR